MQNAACVFLAQKTSEPAPIGPETGLPGSLLRTQIIPPFQYLKRSRSCSQSKKVSAGDHTQTKPRRKTSTKHHHGQKLPPFRYCMLREKNVFPKRPNSRHLLAYIRVRSSAIPDFSASCKPPHPKNVFKKTSKGPFASNFNLPNHTTSKTNKASLFSPPRVHLPTTHTNRSQASKTGRSRPKTQDTGSTQPPHQNPPRLIAFCPPLLQQLQPSMLPPMTLATRLAAWPLPPSQP